VTILPLIPGHSTTRIIERILSSYGQSCVHHHAGEHGQPPPGRRARGGHR
jgi:hypothetical protein